MDLWFSYGRTLGDLREWSFYSKFRTFDCLSFSRPEVYSEGGHDPSGGLFESYVAQGVPAVPHPPSRGRRSVGLRVRVFVFV